MTTAEAPRPKGKFLLTNRLYTAKLKVLGAGCVCTNALCRKNQFLIKYADLKNPRQT